MSWANIRELILQERKIIGPVDLPELSPQAEFEPQQSPLLASYLDTKAGVDSAIRHFSHTLEWPEMSELEKFFVAARLDYAWEITSVLNTCHDRDRVIDYPSAEKCKPSEILEWLLIDIWPYACGRFLQARKGTSEQAVASGRESLKPFKNGRFSCLV
jgi:hypothetical protein